MLFFPSDLRLIVDGLPVIGIVVVVVAERPHPLRLAFSLPARSDGIPRLRSVRGRMLGRVPGGWLRRRRRSEQARLGIVLALRTRRVSGDCGVWGFGAGLVGIVVLGWWAWLFWMMGWVGLR